MCASACVSAKPAAVAAHQPPRLWSPDHSETRSRAAFHPLMIRSHKRVHPRQQRPRHGTDIFGSKNSKPQNICPRGPDPLSRQQHRVSDAPKERGLCPHSPPRSKYTVKLDEFLQLLTVIISIRTAVMAEHLSQSELDYPFKLLEYFNGFRVSKVTRHCLFNKQSRSTRVQ